MKRLLLFIIIVWMLAACKDKTETVKVKSSGDLPIQMVRWDFTHEADLPDGWQITNQKLPDWAQFLVPAKSEDSILFYSDKSVKNKLLSDWQYQDLDITFTFALNQGASFAFQFYDEYQLILSNNPEADISGTLARQDSIIHEPYNQSNRKAVVWQTVAIDAKANLENQLLKINEIYLNQNLIHQDVILPLNQQKQWKVGLIPKQGQFFVEEVRYLTPELKAQQRTNEPVFVADLKYEYYENQEDDWTQLPDFSQLDPTSNGYADFFNINAIKQRNQQYAIVYNGNLKVAEDGEVQIWLASDDGSKLWINNELLISHDGTHGPSEKSASLTLEKGNYPLTLHYFQGVGGAALQLFYQLNDQERKPLNSITRTRSQFHPNPAYTLVPGSEVYLQRGFVGYPQFLDEATKHKFTHTISVGTPEGVHYNYDLASGSLLQVWRGDFINVQTMWQNRGPEQTAVPLAETIQPGAAFNWQFLGGKRKEWPDSLLDAKNFHFKHYELDEKGRPQFHYHWKNAEIVDKIEPTDDGLQRKIVINRPPSGLWLSLAKGRDISENEQGTYLVKEPGYILKILEINGLDLLLREGNGQKELVTSAGMLELDASINYEIIF